MVDSPARAEVTRADVLAFRTRAQGLDRASTSLAEAAVLDVGVQDTGPDGGRWALAVRGVGVDALGADDLAVVWTLRGAPHLYRRADLSHIAAAVEPFSDADAGKRVFDAARPLREAGISPLEALDSVAEKMRTLVTRPMVKGEVSGRLAELVEPPYLRYCRSCQATHLYEQPFRLAALRAGLELEAGTSPPVLRPVPGLTRAGPVPTRFDVIRGYLRLLGPATPKHVAEFLDSPVKEVRAHWPSDTVEVTVEGERRWILAGDEAALSAGPARTIRLLGPYDLFLQGRDRSLLVEDQARAKALWPVLGRPGAVLVDGEIGGLWRPRSSGGRLALALTLWQKATSALQASITTEAERLAAFRGVRLTGLDVTT